MSDIIESNEKQTWDQHIANKNNPHEINSIQTSSMYTYNGYANTILGNSLNDWTYPGSYRTYNGTNGATDYPSNTDGWGDVLVFGAKATSLTPGMRRMTQIFSPWNSLALYFRHSNDTEWGEWTKLATTIDLSNYLPLTGGKMTGAITIDKATNWGQYIFYSASDYYRAIEADDARIRLDIRDTNLTTDRTFIDFYNAKGQPDITQSIIMRRETTTGTSANYKIYGEHNITRGPWTASGNGWTGSGK